MQSNTSASEQTQLQQQQQPICMPSDDDIQIKVKLLDNSQHKLRVRLTDTIANLKIQLERLLAIPVEKQRLIFGGRYLRDEQTLKENQVHKRLLSLQTSPKSNVSSCLDRTRPRDPLNRSTSHNSSSQQIICDTRLPSHDYYGSHPDADDETLSQTQSANMGNNEGEEAATTLSDLEVLQDIFRQWNNIQRVQQTQLQKRMQQRSQGYIYLQKERTREAIQQNFESIGVLMNTTTAANEGSMRSTQTSPLFENQRRELKIGQWVDVNDSDQWLEAQIIRVSECNTKVLVHYNGRNSRYNEWIDMRGDRIAVFHTHTVQSIGSISMSPFPSIEADGDKSEIPERTSFDELLFSSCGLFSEANGRLLKLVSLNNIIKYSNDSAEIEMVKRQRAVLASQLAPIFDRTGRMIMDISMMLGDIGSESQRIVQEEDDEEEEKSVHDENNEGQQTQAMDILSVRSNSSLGRYSNHQTEGTYLHTEREESQYSQITRARVRELYRFSQPVMLNPGELHKINLPLNQERFQIQRIVPSNSNTHITFNANTQPLNGPSNN